MELESGKIQGTDSKKQMEALKKVTDQFDFQLFSVNEIQYDLPGAPNKNYTSTGKNLNFLAKKLELPGNWNSSFAIANTGLKAKRNSKGEFVTTSDPKWREYADLVNFGVVPGQYSTGLLSQYKILNTKVFSDLKWKDFNPQVDLSKYKDTQGNPLPEDMSLFDKNFNDALVKIGSRKVHVIFYHTVPAYGFGNPHSPNIERNRDQLRFLEWYLTGKTDIEVSLERVSIKPLVKGELFVAVGDWNIDIDNKLNMGNAVLQRMFAHPKIHSPFLLGPKKNYYSYLLGGKGVIFDYIAYSDGLEVLEARAINEETTPKLKEALKSASDHRPLWVKFRIK